MGWDCSIDAQRKILDVLFYGNSETATGHGTWPASASLLLFPRNTTHNQGVAGYTSADVLAKMQADIAANPLWLWWWKTIWAGINDITVNGWDGSNTLANIAAMVAQCMGGWYRVFEILPRGDILCTLGSPLRAILDAVNATLAALYGARFVPLLAALQAHGNGGTQDNADIAAGMVPTSLRADLVHLTTNVTGSPDTTTGNGIVFLQLQASIASGRAA